MHEGFDNLLDDLVSTATVGQEVIGEVLARTSLRSPGPVTRGEISEGNPTALRAVDQRAIPQGTVSKAVKALTGLGLLEEKGVKTADARWLGELYLGTAWLIAGVHVHCRRAAPTAVTTAIVCIDGSESSQAVTRQVGGWDDVPAVVLDQIATLAPRAIVDNHPHADGVHTRLFGIGVEVGAPVASGVVFDFKGGGVDVASLFRQRLSGDDRFESTLPVVIENDGDALAVHALRESHYAEKDLVVVAVFDEGIGGGLVIDGQLRRGAGGRSMEIGHMQIGSSNMELVKASGQRFSIQCPCGAYGHVDAIAPPTRIKQRLGIDQLGDVGGVEALEAITLAGSTLGRAIAHICNVVNPSRLMLYLPGELNVEPPAPASAYLEAVNAELGRCFNTPESVPDVHPLPSDRDELAMLGVRAAAACVLQSFIEHALRLDGCQRNQHTAGMRKYMATANTGVTEVRHFAKPMTHAIDVDGRIWTFYASREEAESGADLRRRQGHAVTVVDAVPYEPERSFEKADYTDVPMNVAGVSHDSTEEAWPFARR